MLDVSDESAIEHRYRLLAPHFTDHELRMWAAVEAASHGKDGIKTLARITGIRRRAISRAQQELRIKSATNTSPSSPTPTPPTQRTNS